MAVTQSPLTPRQLEVLELMARGLTNKEIAGTLGISPGTAKNHLSAVFEALDVTNRTEAAMVLAEMQEPDVAQTERVPGFGARPTIAILPFDNMSSDPEQTFFADGLVEDLTTRLAAWRWFPVIARTTTFALRGQDRTAPEIGQSLGARYVMEGSTRRSGDRVRINVQLIDATNAAHVFAKHYDRQLDDVFAVQDEIVETIIGILEPTLLRIEGMRTQHRAAEELDTWELFQRGVSHAHRQTLDDWHEAIQSYDAAIAREPSFAPAHAARAQAKYAVGLAGMAILHTYESTPVEHEEALRTANAAWQEAVVSGRRATELDPLDPAAYTGLGAGLGMTGEAEKSEAAFARAAELDPSNAVNNFSLASSYSHRGCAEQAIPLYQRAIRLSPHDPYLHHFEGALAGCLMNVGRYEEALAAARDSRDHEPANTFGYRPIISASLAFLGRMDEAREEVETLRSAAPDWNLKLARVLAPTESVDKMKEGLRLAGWDVPE